MPAGQDVVRRTELLASLSLAVDIGMRMPMETGLRTCLRAVRLAELLAVDADTVDQVFHLALLGHVGCTGDAHLVADLVGDEQEFARRAATVAHGEASQMLRVVVGLVGAGEPAARRLVALARALPRLKGAMTTTARTHCDVAQLIAGRFGLGAGLHHTLGCFYERWDGKGLPAGLRGEAVPLAVRIVQVAEDLELNLALGDPAAAGETLRDRAGRAFDPAVVAACAAHLDELAGLPDHGPAGTGRASAWGAVLAADPAGCAVLAGAEVDDALEALAGFADLKSFATVGHSQGVARLAGDAARGMGLEEDDAVLVRRAALVHDVGRAAVPVRIWDKPGPLSLDEWEQVRLHAYHGERVLSASPFLSGLGAVAGRHHERLDGAGYHRGSQAPELTPAARLLAVADRYHAMGEDRPHRPALRPEQAAELLAAAARQGELDGEAVRAVLEAAGQPRPRIPRPAGLTEREVEVLRLVARGLGTKQIARQLGIAAKTADNHLQHTYAKIGVSTRAGAAVFAMQHGLADATGGGAPAGS